MHKDKVILIIFYTCFFSNYTIYIHIECSPNLAIQNIGIPGRLPKKKANSNLESKHFSLPMKIIK